MVVPRGGLSWKAVASISVGFFVMAGMSAALMLRDPDEAGWRWLLPFGWVCLGIAQAWEARKRYKAQKRAAAEAQTTDE
ncbi:hypothetical protein [Herbiconiux sp.]|uniref:hypothetical protein n=1 Tax=Herbiconiux sp. TaxID=1871186 RepID=UPI0025B7B81C|nr:hypothetical protein [Herbiconiux sp.]